MKECDQFKYLMNINHLHDFTFVLIWIICESVYWFTGEFGTNHILKAQSTMNKVNKRVEYTRYSSNGKSLTECFKDETLLFVSAVKKEILRLYILQ